MSKAKKSFISGALTSSAGIFVSKALGLLYMVPFTAMAGGEKNMFFYSQAYTYYDVLLQLSTAGIPFAIAAMVAKYANKGDYKTVLLIRKCAMALMLLSGFVMAIFFVLLSSPLSVSVLGKEATASDIQTMKNTFLILSVAIVFVPFLSSYRAFYQGLKELKAYAFSQVLEQLTRVLSLLGLGAICVYIFKMDSIYAIYMAVVSTSIAAIIAIIYYINFDKKNIGVINRAARLQDDSSMNAKEIIIEMVAYGVPYFIAAILGNSMNIVNNNYFMNAMAKTATSYEDAKVLLAIIQVQCNKLTSIPQVLAIGFSTGIVPYLTISLENKNWSELQKNVNDALDTVLYIAMPLCFCLFALAEPIYYVMYGNRHLAYGADALRWSSLLALTGTLSPICSSMMMALRFRQQSLLYLLLGFIVKIATFFPMIHLFGYSGAITSSVVTSVVVIYCNLRLIKDKFNVSYEKTWNRFFRMVVSIVAMNGLFYLLQLLFPFDVSHKLISLFQLLVYGSAGLLIYVSVSSWLQLPQAIFGKSVKNLLMRGK